VNKNGKLEPTERHSSMPKDVQPFDTNTNGVLDAAGFQAFIADRQAKSKPAGAPKAP
jgi:hypothetical protein